MPAHGATRFTALGLIYVIWGSTYFAVSVVVDAADLSPVQLQFLRCAASTALAALVAVAARARAPRGPSGVARARIPRGPSGVARARAPRGPSEGARARTPRGPSDGPSGPSGGPSGPWTPRLVAMGSGVLLWTLGNGLTTIAAAHTASSFIVMSMGTIPLWTVAVEAVVARQAPSTPVMAAVTVGFLGLGLVLAPGLSGGGIIEAGYAPLVLTLLMVSALTWVLGTVVQERVGSCFGVAELSAWQFLGATLTLAVPAVVSGGAFAVGRMGADQWLALAYLVCFGSLVAMAAYAVVLRSFTPAVASTFAYVNPLVGILLGAFARHEPIAPISLVGLVVVLGAVARVLLRPPDPQAGEGADEGAPTRTADRVGAGSGRVTGDEGGAGGSTASEHAPASTRP